MDENLTPENTNQPDIWLVDRLMASDGGHTEDATEPERVRIAQIIDALHSPATAAELADEDSYLSAFDATLENGRKPVRTLVIGTRAALVAGVAVLTAATGAAAYTGSLPGPLQRAAHSVVGAPNDDGGTDQASGEPTDEPTDSPTGTPTVTPTDTPTSGPTATGAVGPDATGPAAFGLCTAWSKGGLAKTSIAFRNLSTAAGGADGITAYCATIVKPGNGSTHGTRSSNSHPTGSPTSHPHGSPTSHPGNSSHPKGSPTTHPGGH